MWFGVVTLFPEMFQSLQDYGITSRAIKNKLLNLSFWNPRDYCHDKHRTVDDRPYGGGPGMLMKVEPLQAAIQQAKQASESPVLTIYLSPQGKVVDHAAIRSLATNKHIILVAGRYEGVDERVIQSEIDQEWSIGDYVLTGGELAAMVMIDAITRQLPGALGHEDSANEDSFVNNLLDYPHYTRPEVVGGSRVPGVLTSGNHEEIQRWRLKQALGRTWLRRPDLLTHKSLSRDEQKLLDEFISEYGAEIH